jgi:hypothetical protein
MPVHRGDDLGLETVQLHQITYHVRSGLIFNYDVPSLVARILAGEPTTFTRSPREVTLYYRDGFATHIDNHEFVSRYVGRTRKEIEGERPALQLAVLDRRPAVSPASVL